MTSTMRSPAAASKPGKISEVFLYFGIALAVLGVLAITASFFVTIGTVVLVGALMVAAGIAQFIHAFRAGKFGKVMLNILSGLIYLIAGGLTIYNPVAGAMSLTLIMSAFFIASGIIRCAHAISHRKESAWGWFLLGGIVDLALGIVIAIGWPVTGLWVIGLFVGIEMLMHGIAWIILSTVVLPDVEKAIP